MKTIAGVIGSSLKLKLILLILTIVGLAVGAAPWSTMKMQERQLIRDSRDHLKSTEEILRAAVNASMLLGEPDKVQRLIEALSSHEGIKTVRIFDTGGVIHFSSDPSERGRRLSHTDIPQYRGVADPLILSEMDGEVMHTLLQPIYNQEQCASCHPADQKVLGLLQISLSLERTWAQLDSLKRSALFGTLIALGVIIAGTWLSFTFFVDQPLRQLVDVMGRAEKGDLTVRAEVHNRDELGRLSRHFNDMISKLHTAQGELEEYHNEQLARADRLASIGEMAAAIAHEIRNPLTGISGALSVLSRDFPAGDPRRDIVQQTRLLIARLNNTVEDILHYSRPSLPQLQNVRLDDVIARSLSLAENEARKAHIQLIKEPAADGSEAPTVSVDSHQIQQVLLNLILNAIQASSAGGQVTIRTRITAENGAPARAAIEVEDYGKGMTPEETAQAFQPFFSTKAHGTGLGLPIARQIVEHHHGQISLRSTPGVGTCVQVELPVQPC